MHPDPGGHGPEKRVHRSSESDPIGQVRGHVQRPRGTASTRGRDRLRPVQGLRRRAASATSCRRRGRSDLRTPSSAAGSTSAACRVYQRPDDATAAGRSGACKTKNTVEAARSSPTPARRTAAAGDAAARAAAARQRRRRRHRPAAARDGTAAARPAAATTAAPVGRRRGRRLRLRPRRQPVGGRPDGVAGAGGCHHHPSPEAVGAVQERGNPRSDDRPAAWWRRRPGRSARGAGGRRVPRPPQDRRGRDGVGLLGRPARDRQARRDQGAGAAHRREPGAGAPVRRRGARRQQDRPPEHRRHLLVRVAARPAPLLRDGVSRRPEPGRSHEARSVPARRGAAAAAARSARRWRRRTGRGSSTAI